MSADANRLSLGVGLVAFCVGVEVPRGMARHSGQRIIVASLVKPRRSRSSQMKLLLSVLSPSPYRSKTIPCRE